MARRRSSWCAAAAVVLLVASCLLQGTHAASRICLNTIAKNEKVREEVQQQQETRRAALDTDDRLDTPLPHCADSETCRRCSLSSARSCQAGPSVTQASLLLGVQQLLGVQLPLQPLTYNRWSPRRLHGRHAAAGAVLLRWHPGAGRGGLPRVEGLCRQPQPVHQGGCL